MSNFAIVCNNPVNHQSSFRINQNTGEIIQYSSKSKARKLAQYLNLPYPTFRKYSVCKLS